MPLTEEQTAAIAAFATSVEGADAKEVAEALKASAAPVYQAAFQSGHSTATAAGKVKIKDADATIAALTAERDEAKAEAERLAQSNPDHAAEKQRLEQALAAAKEAAKNAEKEATERIKAERQRTASKEVVATLIEKGVHPDYAKEVLAAKLAPRIRVGDPGEDGTSPVEYLDADGLTPIQAGVEGFVSQVVTGLDPVWIKSNADSGAGAKGSNGAPANGRLTQLQQAAKSRYTQNGATNSEAAKRREERWAPSPSN